MPLHLVNTVPDEGGDQVKPGGPFHFGLRSSVEVTRGSIEIMAGSSDLRHRGELPEADQVFLGYGGSVDLRSIAHVVPETGTVPRAISDGNLVFTRTVEGDTARCVYELSMPSPIGASVMGYVRFRKETWQLLDRPDWLFRSNVAGVYVGLRQHEYHGGVDVFLEQDGLVTAGPLQSLRAPRPLEQSHALAWEALPDGTPIELWLVGNTAGIRAPFFPAEQPVVDVWVRAGAALPLQRVLRAPIGALGQDPSLSSNERTTLLFGLAGGAGQLVVEDWGLFLDFRMAIDAGDVRGGHEAFFSSASPSSYRATAGVDPTQVLTGKWRREATPSVITATSFSHQPGDKASSQAVGLRKIGTGLARYTKDEPLLEESATGFMVEAFIAGIVDTFDHVIFGAGLEVADGHRLYRVVMVTTPEGPRYALARGGGDLEITSYDVIPDVEFGSLKLVRLTCDRHRDELTVHVDGELKLTRQLSVAVLPNTTETVVRLGHLISCSAEGLFSLAMANLYASYLAYEAKDEKLPSDPSFLLPFDTLTGGTAQVAGGILKITKPDFSDPGSSAVYSQLSPVQDTQGAWAEFRCRIPYYTDDGGNAFAPRGETGVGFTLHLGATSLRFGFFSCGAFGRHIGIVPDGGIEDILDQTPKGRRYSVAVDWTDWVTCRVHYRPYEKIEVWFDTTVAAPQLVIPWDRGFGLPQNQTPAFEVEFGHYSANEASVSEWEFVRWGLPTGFDVSVAQAFTDDPPAYLYGGDVKYLLTFADE